MTRRKYMENNIEKMEMEQKLKVFNEMYEEYKNILPEGVKSSIKVFTVSCGLLMTKKLPKSDIAEMEQKAQNELDYLNGFLDDLRTILSIMPDVKEREVREISHLQELKSLIDQKILVGCGNCNGQFEKEDFAFAIETGTCPYCHEVLTKGIVEK